MGRVLVIGGGNVAYDVARAAVRTPGTQSVSLACLEARHEMPADDVEVHEGDEEGIKRYNRHGPVRFVEGPNGRVAGVEFRNVSRVFDENGKFNPEMVPGTETVVECDTVLIAVGQVGDTTFATGVQDFPLGRAGTVAADRETGRTSLPWLFAAGDGALGPGLFINAVAHGRKTALSIDAFLRGAAQPAAADVARAWQYEPMRKDLRSDYLKIGRTVPPPAPVAERLRGAQVELPFDEAEAKRQAARCVRCEVETIFDGNKCIQCGGCSDVCPTWCLRLVSLEEIGMQAPGGEQMSAIIKDEDRCIRCAMCVERCPTDAITMEKLCGFEPWEPVEGTAA
jgi:NADPH-dependent glutamate synthase beta subunit-like oxidoreductase